MIMTKKKDDGCVVNKLKAKIIFMTAWMLYGASVGFAAPATDVTEQQQRAIRHI